MASHDEPSWLRQCLEYIKEIGGDAHLCSEQHCEDEERFIRQICNCEKPYYNGCAGSNPPHDCCKWESASPVFMPGPNCYCCCGRTAQRTQIAVGENVSKPAEQLLLSEDVYVAPEADLSSWGHKPVQFSFGTGAVEAENALIWVQFGSPEDPGSIFASRHQLFLMPTGKLKRASKLVPGQDQLVRQDGTTVPVLEVIANNYGQPVHHVATSAKPAGELAGHLLLVNGEVCADYALELANLDLLHPQLLVEDHANLPDVGTEAYIKAQPHLAAHRND